MSGGAGIGGDIRIAGNAVVVGKMVAGANGAAATTNKLTIYGQSQFNGNVATTGTLNVTGAISGGSLSISGAATIKGATTVKTLTISDTTNIGHLSFSRSDGPNYIKAPNKIAFNVGSTLSLETCALTIGSNYVVPGVTDYSSLGTEDIFWKEVYATALHGTNGYISNMQGDNALFSTKVGCQFDPSKNANSIYLYVDEELEERGLKDDVIGPIISITDTSTHIFAGPRPGGLWCEGRDNAWLKDDYAPLDTTKIVFYPLLSKKTFKGSWDIGIVMPNSTGLTADLTDYSTEAYRHSYESFTLSYVTDANYTASSNQTTKFKFYPDGGFLCEDLITTGYGTTVPADTDGYNGQVFFKIIS